VLCLVEGEEVNNSHSEVDTNSCPKFGCRLVWEEEECDVKEGRYEWQPE